jgi:ATP-dependent Lhr-like helicase
MTWETVDVNVKSKVIFVKRVPGISVVDWDVDGEVDIHTVLARKMRSVLETDEMYPYLSERCRQRLEEIRYIAHNSGILKNLVTPLAGKKFAVFPWLGTREIFTMHYILLREKIKNKLPWITAPYLEVHFDGNEKGAQDALQASNTCLGSQADISKLQPPAQQKELEEKIFELLSSKINLYDLPLPEKVQVNGKYNEFIPRNLLRKQFIEDYLQSALKI